MVKNKKIILSFLFLAWTIIFAHSIIPHDHHEENIAQECNDCLGQENHLFEKKEIHDCDTDCHDYTCHFHVEILVKVSIDSEFISTTENSFYKCSSNPESFDSKYSDEFISDKIPKTDYLRGPPFIS